MTRVTDEPRLPEQSVSIKEASALTGVPASTIRWYEGQGLLNLARTPGGHRLFAAEDIERIRRIHDLRVHVRLNAPAIASQIGSAPRSPARALAIGRQLRVARKSRGLTLSQVAEQTGLSISFLSMVERDESGIALGNLTQLGQVYGLRVASLIAGTPPQQDLVRSHETYSYMIDDDRVHIEELVAGSSSLSVQRATVQPGGGTGPGYTHVGEDFVYVVSGHLTYWLDGELFELGPGDSLHFDSARKHRWTNQSDSVAVAIFSQVGRVRA